MTLAELIAEVYLLTNRPDRVAMTTSAVKAATLKAHKSDFFSKDIHEIPLSSIAVLELKTLELFFIQVLDIFFNCLAL